MTSLTDTSWDVVIVGGGAAGLSAALILARARRRVLVVDGGEPRNRFAAHMHGVLGRDGHSPLQLVADGRREVIAADGVVETARVESVTRGATGFDLRLEDGRGIRASRLIIATGIRDDLPSIPGLVEQWGRGVVACPYCDGYEARGKRIGVLAGSVAGVHKAHMLHPYSPDVTVLTALVGDLPEADHRALTGRGARIEGRTIMRLITAGDTLTGVEFADGSALELDALFVDPEMVPLDDLLRQLDADRVEIRGGLWTSRDESFQSSVSGVWAVGNVANPGALVPVAMAEGVAAAVAINTAMIVDDLDAETITAAEYWENRYRENGKSWSGRVNAALEREIAGQTPGTALDLGSGEGGDALWLARNGWTVTAVDISPTALAIGAAEQLPGDRIEWVAADLGEWRPETTFDLVTSCFLHSTVDLPRVEILRKAASAVAPGGQFLVVGHHGAPHWARHDGQPHSHDSMELPDPETLLGLLELDLREWTVLTSALIERPVTGPDGTEGSISDSVLRLRRM